MKRGNDQGQGEHIRKELNYLRAVLLDLDHTLERLESMADPAAVHKAMKEHPERMDLRVLRRIARDLVRFLADPPAKVDGRRKHPDSERERKRFLSYREKGLTIRDIAEKTGMSPYTANQKLKRYNKSL